MIPKKLLVPSREQWEFLVKSTARQNWAHGPVRSGKNHVINIRFAEALGTAPFGNEDSDVYFGGKTKDTVERIFLRDLFKWVGEGNYTYNRNKGKGTISLLWKNTKTRFTREFYSFGYSDADSHEAISGATLGLAYLTEGIFCHEDFHRQLVARLSIDEGPNAYSMLFGDTNPAGPAHWLWKKVINNPDLLNSGDLRAFLFNFYSNPSLTESYREMLRRQYGPGSLWYLRLIEGLWVMAEGVIYGSVFNPERNTCQPEDLPTEWDELWCAIDYGTTNPFVCGLWGTAQGKDWLIDSYDHEGGTQGDKTNAQYLADITEFLTQYSRFYEKPITSLYIDPSAASFKAELLDWRTDDRIHDSWRKLGITVVDAENEVLEGIKTVHGKLHRGEIVACAGGRNKRWHNEVGVYAWCPKAAARGEDAPIKKEDHSLDQTRYGIHTRAIKLDPFAGWR